MNIIIRSLLTFLTLLIFSNLSFSGDVVSWKFRTSGIIYSTPLIINDIVYIGSADSSFYAINISDGSKIWSYKSGNQIFSSAAYSNNIICFESGNVLYGLNTDGSEKWKVTIAEGSVTNHYDDWDYFHSSPVISDSVAYAGSQRGQLIGVNIFSGKEVLRINTGDNGIGIRVKPAVHDKKIYFGECSGKFYCYNIDTGEKVWEYNTNPEKLWQDPAILTNPVIKDGIVYFGGRHCHLYGLDVLTGKKIWWYSDPNNMWILGGPAISDSLLYIGSSNQKIVHSFNLGLKKLLWKKNFDGRIFGTPFADSENIFFGTGMEINDKIGSIYAINKISGELVNRFFIGAQVHSSPVINGNKIIFGCKDGYVYALDKEKMLNCEHPESGFSEEGEINLGELKQDTTIKISVTNSSNVADSVSFTLYGSRIAGSILNLDSRELNLPPHSQSNILLTIKASLLNANNYLINLSMIRHFYINPAAQVVIKKINFTVPKITSISGSGNSFSFFLSQNFPNPFNPSTKIKYSVGKAGGVEIKVFNLIGKEMATLVSGYKNAGNYEVIFSAEKFPSGIYYYRLTAGDFVSVKKLAVIK
ncbi:MAG: PQQ-binding-like beta-propeller repeat protein [Ignavibacteriaceae bacterium]